MTQALTFLLASLISGCENEEDKSRLFSKKEICTDIYREKFLVSSGGAYSAEIFSDYLTDSINFRILIGTHDEHDYFNYKCSGDSILIQKFGGSGEKAGKLLLEQKFSLSSLRREHKFE